MPSIPIEEVKFHPLSYQDEGGRLFWKDGRLYRGIYSSWVAFYDELFRSGYIDELVRDGLLVESRMTDLTMQGYPRIVEHSVIPFVSFGYEWCPEMLRDAGRLILDLATRLLAHDLEMTDAHAGNVLYQGTQPVFVDLGALAPVSQSSEWPGAVRFRENFLNPLYLASAGAGDVARSLMQTNFYGRISASQVKYFSLRENLVQRTRAGARELVGRVMPSRIQELLREKFPRHRSGGSQASHLAHLKEELESIPMPQPQTPWSAYYGDRLAPLEPSPEWNPKQRQAFDILDRIKPATVLDIGANRGWFSLMAAKQGASVVAMDTESACISRLYADARAQSLGVLPLIIDIRSPSPARGLCGELCPPAWDRFRSEVVLAFAIVHHLALRSRLTFDQIVGLLKRFTTRQMLVEFPLPEDYAPQDFMRAGDSWYTSENFQAVLRRHFRAVERYPSESATREIYVCEV